MQTNRILKPGCNAFWDTFAGLVPCKVTRIEGARPDGIPSTCQTVFFTLTDDRGAYRKGENHSDFALHVVPPGALVRGQYSTRIGAYVVQGAA